MVLTSLVSVFTMFVAIFICKSLLLFLGGCFMTEPSRSNRRPFLLLFSGIAFFVALWRLDVVAAWGGALLSLLTPFIAGLCVAFILNVLMRFLENKAFAPLNKRCGKVWRALRRPLCLILTMAIFRGRAAGGAADHRAGDQKHCAKTLRRSCQAIWLRRSIGWSRPPGSSASPREQLALPQVDWGRPCSWWLNSSSPAAWISSTRP